MPIDDAGGKLLLATRLHVPRTRAVVVRSRLAKLLDDAAPGSVILVAAPAGSGKTTLLAEWVRDRQGASAWFSAEAGDDARTLVAYVEAGLRASGAIGSGVFLDAATGGSRGALQQVVTELLNALASSRTDLTLVLDDCHLLADDAQEVLSFIATHLPRSLRLVIATRADPPIALSRLRTKGILSEIRAADLRFNVEEAAEFLRFAMQLDLSDAEIGDLEQRTEGWAAGLQLAAISLRGRDRRSAFISEFAGSNRYVLDYVTDEVLEGLSEEVRSFLLDSSILDQLSASLCDAVRARSDSAKILRELEAANLFLVPLDDERHWFRYHHLFAAVLRNHAPADAATQRVLHVRASVWYRAANLPEQAIRHASAAADFDRASAIIIEAAPALALNGASATILRWIAMLPPERVTNDVELMLLKAGALVGHYELEEARQLLARLETIVGPDSPMRGRLLAAKGMYARMCGDDERSESLFASAVEHLPDDSFWKAMAAFNLGLGAVHRVEFPKAEALFSMVRRHHSSPEALLPAVLAQSYTAYCRLWSGAPHRAKALAEESLEWIDRQSGDRSPGFAALPYAVLADVYREWHQLDRARELALRAVECGAPGFRIGFIDASRALARVADARGDRDTALRSIASALGALGGANRAWVGSLEALRQRIILRHAILQNDAASLGLVGAWIEEEGFDRDDAEWRSRLASSFYVDYGFLAAARWMVERERYDDALRILQQIDEAAILSGRHLGRVEILVTRSLAEARAGDEFSATASMCEAIDAAAPPGFLMPFVAEGGAVLPVLKRAVARTKDRDFATRLLSALADGNDRPQLARGEALTGREVEVLRLVAQGVSNQDAARRLFIAPGTVKKHLDNIFSKLDVRNRTEAVSRARELGLV